MWAFPTLSLPTTTAIGSTPRKEVDVIQKLSFNSSLLLYRKNLFNFIAATLLEVKAPITPVMFPWCPTCYSTRRVATMTVNCGQGGKIPQSISRTKEII
jgi:hypothetical protein